MLHHWWTWLLIFQALIPHFIQTFKVKSSNFKLSTFDFIRHDGRLPVAETGPSNPRLRRDIGQPYVIEEKFPVAERVEAEPQDVESEAVVLENLKGRSKHADKVAQSELKFDEPSPNAEAVRKGPGIIQVDELERQRQYILPQGEQVKEDYQNQQHYGDYDYGDDASSGSKDGASDDLKKSLTSEKVDTILELMNKLSKEFASILGKESAANASKDAKGSKDSKDSKDTKDSKDSKDKDSKDGKGAKSDYDYDSGSQAVDSTASSTSSSSSTKFRPTKSAKIRKTSKMSSVAKMN